MISISALWNGAASDARQYGKVIVKLEALTPGTTVRGVVPDHQVRVVTVDWFGSNSLELTFKDATGRVDSTLLYRDDEARLEVAEKGRPWSFDGDAAKFRLVAEAQRIRLAHLL